MLGMWCSSGPTPVVMVEAHTGVTEGNAATQSSTYTPASRIRASAGARPAAMTRSSMAGFMASTTTSTSFLRSLALIESAEDAQTRVFLLAAPPTGDEQPQQQPQHDDPDRRQQDRERRRHCGASLSEERQGPGRLAAEPLPHPGPGRPRGP